MRSRHNSLIGTVVLAAGKSTRMGEPKQLVTLDGRPLLAHTLENVRASRVDEIVLVLGFAAEAIRAKVALPRVKVVENENYEQGMGSSLRVGLSSLDASIDASLMVLGDQPFVRPQTFDEIINAYRQSEAQIVVPTYRGFRGNPVLLDRSVFAEVMALSGDVGCRAIFGNHSSGIVKVPVGDVGILLDIDSKQDLVKAQELSRGTANSEALMGAVDLDGRSVRGAEGSPSAQDNLILIGTEPVAATLGKLARILGFRVTVVDPLARVAELPDADEVLNTLDLSPLKESANRYVVIASRGRFDEEAIEQAFAANIGYVALVANRKRAEEVRRRVHEKGHAQEKLSALRTPAGLDIRAKTPEEIALSILAEIVSVKHEGQ
jgi:molybdenum cofactor cytidylyltransferase